MRERERSLRNSERRLCERWPQQIRIRHFFTYSRFNLLGFLLFGAIVLYDTTN
jgi:hypothetical protein